MAKKDDKQKAEKKKRGKKGAPDDVAYSSIATHPRARASVRKIKAWTGLGAFVIAAALSLKASVPTIDVGERALIAGIAGYMLAWWFSMLVWRHLMLAEQRAAVEEIERRRADAAAREATGKT
ncbi:MAG TPA: hypothetical protein VME01_03225 [Solirubrobacteraceae bacterium]|nr:hypothetical protein [Solirubrobacteraceae bacterium]